MIILASLSLSRDREREGGGEFANLRIYALGHLHRRRCLVGTEARVPPQISGTGGMLWSVPPQILTTIHNFFSHLEQFIEH
jgi:hypothetical protein